MIRNQNHTYTNLSIRKLGMALGLTGVLAYLGCIILMVTVGYTGTVQFFNSLLHGLDVSDIIRPEVPLWEAALGVIQTFVLGWLAGAAIAGIYNVSFKNS
ncbi:MAG: hypothetical protein KKG00_10105 [Bacteroidetes bacterium]|nr:hypothetical protein [Bacteroidota bacterium]